jgi:hypothetical protein
MDQLNKALAYFCRSPEEMQCMCHCLFHDFFLCGEILTLHLLLLLLSEQLVEKAINEMLQLTQATTIRNMQTTKDDIVWLIHL